MQNTEHRLQSQIFDESAGLAENTVNGGFPGSPRGAVESIRQSLNCIPRAIRLRANPHLAARRYLPSFPPCVILPVDGIFPPEAAGPGLENLPVRKN
jgi:hypothetical protein